MVGRTSQFLSEAEGLEHSRTKRSSINHRAFSHTIPYLGVLKHAQHVCHKDVNRLVESVGLEASLDEGEVDRLLDDLVIVWHLLLGHWRQERPGVWLRLRT